MDIKSIERRNRIKSPQEVLVLCREKDIQAVDLRFTGFFGRQHQITIPIYQLNESSFEDGFGVNGAGIRGWQSVDESDLLVIPQPNGAWVDATSIVPTLVLVCSVVDPVTREDYVFDPRCIAQRAENYLVNSGVADAAYFGPEAEFFIFDSFEFESHALGSRYAIRTSESQPCSPSDSTYLDRLNHVPSTYPVHANYWSRARDDFASLRGEMMRALIDCGIEVECHHHELASAGQSEIDIKYDSLVTTADNLMAFKHVVRNVAKSHGKTVTFMPKPIATENGNGLHVHFSLWKSNEPLFAGNGYAGLSDIGLHAIGGLLRHAPALLAITNPSTNSYRRLVPGFGAPVNLSYSQRNRSAACRIPMTSTSPKSRRIEFRVPDPSCNPYLGFAAILMAAIDGIQNKMHPGEALDRDMFGLTGDELLNLVQAPKSLDESLSALEHDYEFLLRGDVFSEEALKKWIETKRLTEIEVIRRQPHPQEFCMYYDC